ncbi:MAG: DUF2207 domain-containing protein [Patescibacteria group bacterium]
MKAKYLFLSAIAILGFVLPGTAKAEEVIKNFDVTATVQTDRNVIFEEKITYDFGDEERHGIFRYIPEKYYIKGVTYRLRYKVLDILRDGAEEPYIESSDAGDLYLKIGDADVTITGPHEYVIRYSTDRVLNSFDDHDELYWNVTGNEWQVPIEQSSMTIILPAAASASQIQMACYTGFVDSTENACDSSVMAAGMQIKTKRVLLPYEGLTAVFGLPKGIVKELTWMDKIWRVLADNGVIFFPIFAFIIMFSLWRKSGKDPSKGTVIPEYEPPQKLSPAMIGAAMTEGRVPSSAVSATIVDLARRGYLKIKIDDEKGVFGATQKFTFSRLEENYSGLADYEQEIMRGIFKDSGETTLDDLRKEGKFYSTVTTFKSDIQKSIDALKLFDANPSRTRSAYITVAGLLGFFLFFFLVAFPLGVFSAISTAFIIGIFGFFMPRRTSVGIKLLTDIEGFKWFLSVTEKDRMAFHNAPERKPEQFQALLPYAIVFGVEEQWAKQFESMQLPPPEWAEGTAMSHMTTFALISHLSSMERSFSGISSPPSHSSSGGSGFSGGSSGGGGGGGGGGSW